MNKILKFVKAHPWISSALFVLALGMVGSMDANDAQHAANNYCEMVKAGFWPDYQGTYRHECLRPNLAPR